MIFTLPVSSGIEIPINEEVFPGSVGLFGNNTNTVAVPKRFVLTKNIRMIAIPDLFSFPPNTRQEDRVVGCLSAVNIIPAEYRTASVFVLNAVMEFLKLVNGNLPEMLVLRRKIIFCFGSIFSKKVTVYEKRLVGKAEVNVPVDRIVSAACCFMVFDKDGKAVIGNPTHYCLHEGCFNENSLIMYIVND